MYVSDSTALNVCSLVQHCITGTFLAYMFIVQDRLCGLVVRVPGYRSRFPALPDFLEVVGLEYNCGATLKEK
jgi:hypothetical protein